MAVHYRGHVAAGTRRFDDLAPWLGVGLLVVLSVSYFVTGNVVRAGLCAVAVGTSALLAGFVGRRSTATWPTWPLLAAVTALASRVLEHPVSWEPSFVLLVTAIVLAHLTAAGNDGGAVRRLVSRVRSSGDAARRRGTARTATARSQLRAAVSRLDATSAVAAVTTLLVVLAHLVWLARERAGFGLQQDEARILPLSYRLWDGWDDRGVTGAAAEWVLDPVVPPLLPALSAPVVRFSDSPVPLVAVVVVFTTVLLLSGYSLARHLGGRVAGLTALVVLAAMPGVIWYSRVYEQIIPGAALWLAALLCVVRSDGLRHRGWRVAAGLLLGLGLLTRAMLIGILPGLALALLVQWWASPQGRRPRPMHVLQLVALAGTVAATWWLWNADTVVRYLTQAGYGSPDYAPSDGRSPLGQLWRDELRVTETLLGGPVQLSVLLALGGFGLAVAVARAGRLDTRSVRNTLATPEALLAIVGGWGYLVLVVSDHDFIGFGLVNVPILVVLCSSALRYRLTRLLLPVVLVATLSYLPRSMDPGAGWMPILVYGQETTGLREHDQQWTRVARDTVDRCDALTSGSGDPLVIGVATTRILYSGLTMSTVAWQDELGVEAFNLALAPDASRFSGGPAERMNCAVTADPGPGNRAYVLDLGDAEARLSESGFVVAERAELPDGAEQRLWVSADLLPPDS